jgi:hypothetical protein
LPRENIEASLGYNIRDYNNLTTMQNSKTQQCDKIQNVVYEMVGRFGSPLECVEPSIAEEDMEDPEAGRMTILMRNSRKLCKLSEAEMALALAVFEEEDFA